MVVDKKTDEDHRCDCENQLNEPSENLSFIITIVKGEFIDHNHQQDTGETKKTHGISQNTPEKDGIEDE